MLCENEMPELVCIISEKGDNRNMTKDEKTKENTKTFVKQDTEYMNTFRHNVLQLMDDRDITLNQLAELSNLSIDTLKSFLYKESKDCKLVTAVALAKALGSLTA